MTFTVAFTVGLTAGFWTPLPKPRLLQNVLPSYMYSLVISVYSSLSIRPYLSVPIYSSQIGGERPHKEATCQPQASGTTPQGKWQVGLASGLGLQLLAPGPTILRELFGIRVVSFEQPGDWTGDLWGPAGRRSITSWWLNRWLNQCLNRFFG